MSAPSITSVATSSSHPISGSTGARLRFPDGSPQWSGGDDPTLFWALVLASGWARSLRRAGWLEWLRPGDRVSAGQGGEATHSKVLAEGTRQIDVDWVTGAAMTIRRAALEEVGPLDDGFQFYAQDLDLCTRLRSTGWRCAILADVSVLHHSGATTSKSGAQLDSARRESVVWLDLLRWARKHRGESFAWWMKAALWLGTWWTTRPLGQAQRAARATLSRFDPTKPPDFG